MAKDILRSKVVVRWLKNPRKSKMDKWKKLTYLGKNSSGTFKSKTYSKYRQRRKQKISSYII